MATCRPTLFLLIVKEILLVHFIITNCRVAHKMLCTPWLRNPLTTSRLSCLGRKAALTTIFLSVRQSRISQPCYTNNYSCLRPEFGKLQISKSSRNTCIAGLVRLKVGILSCHRFRLAFVIRILSNVNVCSVDDSLKMFFYL
jgi:hypothetical protein